MKCPDARKLWEWQEHDDSEPELQAHLRQCPHCQAVLSRRQLMTSFLQHRENDDEADAAWQRLKTNLGQVEQVKPTGAEGPAPGRQATAGWLPQRYLWPSGVGLALVLLLAVGTFALWRPTSWSPPDAVRLSDQGPEFRPRGEGPTQDDTGDCSQGCPSITAYHIPGHADLTKAVPQPLGDGFRQDDFLLFSYSNKASQTEPYGWLVIVGRDSSGKTHWYQPAEAPADDAAQASVAIQKQAENVDIPMAFRSPGLSEGSMKVAFVFSSSPISRARALAALQLNSGRHADNPGRGAVTLIKMYNVAGRGQIPSPPTRVEH
jgi:hypothetical protein